MKKFLAVFMATVMSVLLVCTAYASVPTVEIYDFDGNLIENPDLTKPWLYGAVFNADGTMAPQPRYNVVDSTITLAAGQTWTSYQYKLANTYFGVTIKTPGTMSGDTYMAIQKASSVGGTRTLATSKTVSKTDDRVAASLNYWVSNTTYMNAQYKNVGNSSSSFRIGIGWDD